MTSNNNKKLVKLDDRVKQVGGTLIIKEAKVEDSGKYLCMVNNSVGGESVETVLTVTGKAKICFFEACLHSQCDFIHKMAPPYVWTSNFCNLSIL